MKKEISKGFTLIELLVVISIIALLSSVVLASLQTAREKAQAAAVRSYLKQVVTALELYRNDHGSYPAGNNYLNRIIDGPLAGYVQHQSPPSFSLHYTDPSNGVKTFYYNTAVHSCGTRQLDLNIEPYVIYWQSSRTLDLPVLINDSGSSYASSRYYCASLITS